MTGKPRSRRDELARLRAQMRGQDRTYREIAERIRDERRVNTRVAYRLAHGLTQTQVAERWNAQWPDQEAPKTAKQVSYWEVWPAPSGRMPSLDTLNKLAFLYRCSAGDLLDGQDHSHLDPAPPPGAAAPERPAEPSPAAAAVPPPVSPLAVAGAAAPLALPGPAEVGTGLLLVPDQFATQLTAQLTGLAAVADGTLGWSARRRDAACQQLVDLFTLWASTMDRRVVLQMLGLAATAAAAGPVSYALHPDDQQRLVAAVQAPGRVDATVLDHLERMLWHCQRQDAALGPQAVLDTVLAQRRLAADLLAECPPMLRPRLLSVYADQSRVAGWLSYNANDFDGAAFYYEHARAAAHEAQDPVVGAFVLSQMSQLATWQQRPRVGIDHAVAAQSWAQRTDDLLLRSWTADTAARAYARDGQWTACMAELDTAHIGFAAAAGQPSRIACGNDEGLHWSIRAECLLQLRRPDEAVQAAERSLATADRTSVRDVAFATVKLGLGRLECGDPDHAAVTFEQAADLAVQNRSARLASKIQAARARMQPWRDSRAVAQLDQRLRAYQLA